MNKARLMQHGAAYEVKLFKLRVKLLRIHYYQRRRLVWAALRGELIHLEVIRAGYPQKFLAVPNDD